MNPLLRKQSPWGLWFTVGFTFGIYYFGWYSRINRELCAVLGEEVPANGKWFAPWVPILNIIGLFATADRVNRAHARVGSQTRVNPVVAGLLAPIWFGSHTRYLQRRINTLSDIVGSGAPAPSAYSAVHSAPTTTPAPILTQTIPQPTTAPESPTISA